MIFQEKIQIDTDIFDNNNIIKENETNKVLDECPLKKNCFLLLKTDKSNSYDNNNNINTDKEEEKSILFGDFYDIESDNNILCLKRDLLLKHCSIYFTDIYFNDKNFLNLKKYFKYNIKNKNKGKIHIEIDKFNYPTKIKNYSNTSFAYPNIFFKPYISFYKNETLKISHPYYHKEVIKKQSFPPLLSHFYTLNNFLNDNDITFFNKECEVIMKVNGIY